MRARLILGLVAVSLTLPQLALAAPADCSTPRNAIASVFDSLRADSKATDKAAHCLERDGRRSEELRSMAESIKAVFDARGIIVDTGALPEAADYADEQGAHRLVVHRDLKDAWVERQADGQWRWPAASLDRMEEIYADTFSAQGDRMIAKLPKALKGTAFGVALWQYLALVVLALMGILLRKVLQYVVAHRVQKLAALFGAQGVSKLVAAIDGPGATLVMAAVLAVAYPQVRLPVQAARLLSVAVHLLIVGSLVWAFYRLADVIGDVLAVKAAKTESKLDDQLVPLARRSMKVLTILVGFLFVLQSLDVDVGSLLAGLGIGGLALAMAAKDTLANFFGSVVIFADKPFQVGDWVAVDGVEGSIEEVGFRSTRIRTLYDSVVTVPNSKIADTKIDNFGLRRFRRTSLTLGLTYETTPEQMQAFVEGLRAIVRANPLTRKEGYEIHFNGFGAYSLDVMVHFFIAAESWSVELRERHNIYLEILRLAESLGVSFAYPTQTLLHERVAAIGAQRELPKPLTAPKLAEVVNAFGPNGAQSRPAGPLITGSAFNAAQPAPEAPAEPEPEAKAG